MSLLLNLLVDGVVCTLAYFPLRYFLRILNTKKWSLEEIHRRAKQASILLFLMFGIALTLEAFGVF